MSSPSRDGGEIVMPRLSDTMEEGTILRWLKRDGDAIIAVKYAKDGAGILSSIVRSDGLVILDEATSELVAGSIVDFLPFSEVIG